MNLGDSSQPEPETRISDERKRQDLRKPSNDTLIKIVDRLGIDGKVGRRKRQQPPAPERGETISSPSSAPRWKMAAHRARPPATGKTRRPRNRRCDPAKLCQRRSPERPIECAPADDGKARRAAIAARRKSPRAFRGKKEGRRRDAARSSSGREPKAEMDFDSPLDPKLANRPLGAGLRRAGSEWPSCGACATSGRPLVNRTRKQPSPTSLRLPAALPRRPPPRQRPPKDARPARMAVPRDWAACCRQDRKTAMVGIAVMVLGLGAFSTETGLSIRTVRIRSRPIRRRHSAPKPTMAPADVELDASVSPLALEAAQAGAPEEAAATEIEEAGVRTGHGGCSRPRPDEPAGLRHPRSRHSRLRRRDGYGPDGFRRRRCKSH